MGAFWKKFDGFAWFFGCAGAISAIIDKITEQTSWVDVFQPMPIFSMISGFFVGAGGRIAGELIGRYRMAQPWDGQDRRSSRKSKSSKVEDTAIGDSSEIQLPKDERG